MLDNMLMPELSVGPAPRVLYEDAHLLAFDKPAGLLAVPGRGADKQDCLASRVQAIYPEARVVHRLDMATSGVMLMARGEAMQRVLSQAFAAGGVRKRYVAVVTGRPRESAQDVRAAQGWSRIALPIAADWPRRPLRVIDAQHGKPSETLWRIARPEGAHATRLDLQPLTGRTHQLRVHLQAIGHPILGDALYAPPEVQALSPRLLLHACALAFTHPATGETLTVESPPPF
jgi:tRNA pseudouridine32 synthase/23S rRNA pseudouridine746 synthase